jgi:hypothetical protein
MPEYFVKMSTCRDSYLAVLISVQCLRLVIVELRFYNKPVYNYGLARISHLMFVNKISTS